MGALGPAWVLALLLPDSAERGRSLPRTAQETEHCWNITEGVPAASTFQIWSGFKVVLAWDAGGPTWETSFQIRPLAGYSAWLLALGVSWPRAHAHV